MSIPSDAQASYEALMEPARELLGQITDKWSLVILSVLCAGPHRFNALRRGVGGITQTSLTTTLRRLERNGIVERRILPGSPPSVEYRVTQLGVSLEEPIKALLGWAATNIKTVEDMQGRYDDCRNS